MLGGYQRILMDNRRRREWDGIFENLKILFMCGKNSPLNGPMIGVTMALRDSDYFKKTAELLGYERSHVAQIEWMATAWNATFVSTGIWMGKTFEPVSLATFSKKCGNNAKMLKSFDPAVVRMGRNFFREPTNPDFIQSLGLPSLTRLWRLKSRPHSTAEKGFDSQLLAENLNKEKYIPYSMTGGLFLSLPGNSVVEEMRGKPVYQLNYRWADLDPVYPMTLLVDELVQIADGVYLGQLVMATSHYSLGTVNAPLFGEHLPQWDVGTPFHGEERDYGYQNNGFFLMIDPAIAKQAYADEAFPMLRPRPGEQGYQELGYDHSKPSSLEKGGTALGGEWVSGWKNDEDLLKKFTRFTLEPSTKSDDGDVTKMLKPGESILQMLQRIQGEISAASCLDDHLRHFEKLNCLFRAGIAPKIVNGVFQGQPIPQKRFGCIDPREILSGNTHAVGKTGGKAGECRLVPGGKPELAGDLPDFLLVHPRFEERGADVAFIPCAHAGPEISKIIGNRSVGDPPDSFAIGDVAQLPEQLGLAVVAAIGRVLPEFAFVCFFGRDDDGACAHARCKVDGPLRILFVG